jgi:hypothetical protein
MSATGDAANHEAAHEIDDRDDLHSRDRQKERLKTAPGSQSRVTD